MHLLILTQFYPPEPHAIPNDIAKEMLRRGHSVTVITGFPNHPLGKIYDGYKQRFFQKETIDGINIIRLPLYPNHSLSKIKRTLSFFSFSFIATLLSPILSPPVDIIFVYHTPTVAIPAWVLSSIQNIPFVFNVQDMYPETLLSLNISKDSLVYRSLDALVDSIYNKATSISVISNGFKDKLVQKGIPAKKINVVRTWADETIYRPTVKDEQLAKEWGLNGKFNIVFAGNMGPAQGLDNVVEAATILKDIRKIQFVLIGDGNTQEGLKKSVSKLQLKNVISIPRQLASEMHKFYAIADILLVHLIDDPIFSITIPCKTQSYMACGKPLLMSISGEAAQMVVAANAGLAVPPSNPSELAGAVRQFYEMSPAELETLGQNARRYFIDNLSLKASMDRYESLFEQTIISHKTHY